MAHSLYDYKWLWLFAEIRYLQCDGQREDGELIVWELGGWNCKKCLKGGGVAEKVGKQKLKWCMFVKVVSALEKGGWGVGGGL